MHVYITFSPLNFPVSLIHYSMLCSTSFLGLFSRKCRKKNIKNNTFSWLPKYIVGNFEKILHLGFLLSCVCFAYYSIFFWEGCSPNSSKISSNILLLSSSGKKLNQCNICYNSFINICHLNVKVQK